MRETKHNPDRIEAGASEAEVRIPIVDDDRTEPDEQFGLFLSVDPDDVQAQP